MRRMMAVAGLGILLALGCEREDAEEANFTPQDEAAVRAIFDSTVTDVRAANFDAWASRFSDDAVFHTSNAPAMSGRAALLAWAKAFPPVESFDFANVQVHGDGNMAYGTSAVLLKIKDLPMDSLKQLVVFRRDSTSGWQIVAVSTNSDLPLPPPPPAKK